MVAWAVVSMWVVGVATGALPPAASLAEGEQWFFGARNSERLTCLPSAQAITQAKEALHTDLDAQAYFELLPYILDPHGAGSRLSIRRNPATQAARTRKRAEGVFYTPADVAEYMTSACLDSINNEELPTVFDPACGTGVFLRAALEEIQRRNPGKNAFSVASECLYGADIDPWALDATAFVLLADIWIKSTDKQGTPAELWHRIRLNYACIDTLLIDSADDTTFADEKSGQVKGHEPVASTTPPSVLDIDRGKVARVSISQLFPSLKRRPRVILGNPPYANLGDRIDFSELGLAFETLAVKPLPNAELFLPFIEQMIRLADKESCSGALVLPLSIACNVGPQFATARELIAKTRGRWRFAFFDREPHALFGEDVKTRNTIMLWSRSSSDKCTRIATGPLRKWRGDSRAAMFSGLQFTEVDGSRMRAGIPKVDGGYQAAAFEALSNRWCRLEQAVEGITRLSLAETIDADDRTVFVGPTAYNFLNVFLGPQHNLPSNRHTLSEHPLHAIKCVSRDEALAVFAVLSSHLTYWWWHTHGDGFHVLKRFIAELPFGLETLSGSEADQLSKYGAELWDAIRSNPIISLNRGRTSVAYTPNGHDDIRRKADLLLANLAGLDPSFVAELQRFTAHTVAAKLREHTIADTKESGRG